MVGLSVQGVSGPPRGSAGGCALLTRTRAGRNLRRTLFQVSYGCPHDARMYMCILPLRRACPAVSNAFPRSPEKCGSEGHIAVGHSPHTREGFRIRKWLSKPSGVKTYCAPLAVLSVSRIDLGAHRRSGKQGASVSGRVLGLQRRAQRAAACPPCASGLMNVSRTLPRKGAARALSPGAAQRAFAQ